MTNELIDKLEKYLDMLDNVINQDATNSLEKINIMTKLEELIYWLEQYREYHLESEVN